MIAGWKPRLASRCSLVTSFLNVLAMWVSPSARAASWVWSKLILVDVLPRWNWTLTVLWKDRSKFSEAVVNFSRASGISAVKLCSQSLASFCFSGYMRSIHDVSSSSRLHSIARLENCREYNNKSWNTHLRWSLDDLAFPKTLPYDRLEYLQL